MLLCARAHGVKSEISFDTQAENLWPPWKDVLDIIKKYWT